MTIVTSLVEAPYERSAGQMSRLISRAKRLGNELHALETIFDNASCLIPAHFHSRLKAMLDAHTQLIHAVLMRRQLSRMGLDDLASWETPGQAQLERQLSEFEGLIGRFKTTLFRKSTKRLL